SPGADCFLDCAVHHIAFFVAALSLEDRIPSARSRVAPEPLFCRVYFSRATADRLGDGAGLETRTAASFYDSLGGAAQRRSRRGLLCFDCLSDAISFLARRVQSY